MTLGIKKCFGGAGIYIISVQITIAYALNLKIGVAMDQTGDECRVEYQRSFESFISASQGPVNWRRSDSM